MRAHQRSIVCAGVFSLVGVLALAYSARSAPGPQRPRVEVLDSERDLGEVARDVWHVSFRVRNSGAARLVLNQLDPDCDCGRVLRTIVVPPDDTAEVTVSLDARHADGPVETRATFMTNDRAQPRLALSVRAIGGPRQRR